MMDLRVYSSEKVSFQLHSKVWQIASVTDVGQSADGCNVCSSNTESPVSAHITEHIKPH